MPTPTNIGSNFLSNLNIPQLGDPTFSADFQAFCEAIRDNFNRLISVQYTRGEKGNSVETRHITIDVNLSQDTLLSNLGNGIVKAIYGCDDNTVICVGITPPQTQNIIGFNDLLDRKAPVLGTDGKVSMPNFWIDGDHTTTDGLELDIAVDEENGKAYLFSPYLFIDGRIADLSTYVREHTVDDIQNFTDYSTAIYGIGTFDSTIGTQMRNDVSTWTWSIHRHDIIPKLYYDDNIREFCWLVNNQRTGITAQGIKGDTGYAPKFIIAAGIKYVQVGTTSYIDIKYIQQVNSNGEIIWTSITSMPDEYTIDENDIVLTFYRLGSSTTSIIPGDLEENFDSQDVANFNNNLFDNDHFFYAFLGKAIPTGDATHPYKVLCSNSRADDIFHNIFQAWLRQHLNEIGHPGALSDLRGLFIPGLFENTWGTAQEPGDDAPAHIIFTDSTDDSQTPSPGDPTFKVLHSAPVPYKYTRNTITESGSTHTNIDPSQNRKYIGDWLIDYNIDVQGNSLVHGNSMVQGDSYVQGNLSVDKNISGRDITAGHDLLVHGRSFLQGPVEINEDLTVTPLMDPTGTTIVNNVNLQAPVIMNNILSVQGRSNFQGNVTMQRNLSVQGNTFIQGDLGVQQNLSVQGNTYTQGMNTTHGKLFGLHALGNQATEMHPAALCKFTDTKCTFEKYFDSDSSTYKYRMKVYTNLNIRIGILPERNVWEDQINTRFLQGVNKMSTSTKWKGTPNEQPRVGDYSRTLSRMYDVVEYNIPIDKELTTSVEVSQTDSNSYFGYGFNNILIINPSTTSSDYNDAFGYSLTRSFQGAGTQNAKNITDFDKRKKYVLKYKNTNITCNIDLYFRIKRPKLFTGGAWIISVTPVGLLEMKELGGQNIFAPIYGSACVQGNLGHSYFIENTYPSKQPYNTPITLNYINPIISWVYEDKHTINISNGLLEGGTIYKYTGQTYDLSTPSRSCSFTVYSDSDYEQWDTAIGHIFYGGTITINNDITYSITTMECSNNRLVFNINGQESVSTHIPTTDPNPVPVSGTVQSIGVGYFDTEPSLEFITEHSVPNSEAVTYLGVFGKHCLGEINDGENNPYHGIQMPDDFTPQNPLYNSIMPGINMIEGNPGIYANNMDDGEFELYQSSGSPKVYSWKSHEKIFPTVFMTQSNGYLGPNTNDMITAGSIDTGDGEFGVYFWPVAASYNTPDSVIDGILTYPYTPTIIGGLQGQSLVKKGDMIPIGDANFFPDDVSQIADYGYHYINGGPLGPCKTMGVVSDTNISVRSVSSN